MQFLSCLSIFWEAVQRWQTFLCPPAPAQALQNKDNSQGLSAPSALGEAAGEESWECPENHAGSGHAEMGCSDSSCWSVNALHSSPSARLTSCCSTAKNNHSPDERKCTGRVRGRQWFWQGCSLGKAGRGGNGGMEREDTAPRNPCVCRGFIACTPPSDLQIPCVSALKISFPAARSSSPAEAVS